MSVSLAVCTIRYALSRIKLATLHQASADMSTNSLASSGNDEPRFTGESDSDGSETDSDSDDSDSANGASDERRRSTSSQEVEAQATASVRDLRPVVWTPLFMGIVTLRNLPPLTQGPHMSRLCKTTCQVALEWLRRRDHKKEIVSSAPFTSLMATARSLCGVFERVPHDTELQLVIRDTLLETVLR